MRIQLLLQREPFGSILERTLARFWAGRYGRQYRVNWQRRWLALETLSRWSFLTNGSQPWLANVYLNAIFTPQAAPGIFDPLRRGFSRSPVWWKRPLQRTYISLASSRRVAPWLAQATLHVSPAVPDADHQVIVAGNHKIRILDIEAGLAYGILKEGFDPGFMARELMSRRQAADNHLPVPPLVSVAADQSWFSERYVSGIPVNRLGNAPQAQEAILKAAHHLHRFLCSTRTEIHLENYLNELLDQIEALIAANRLLSTTQRQTLGEQARALAARAMDADGSDCRLTTALGHGDFQPANILLNRYGVWLLDWEYAGRRQAGYDALVLALAARFPRGLAGRLAGFVQTGWPPKTPVRALAWPGMAVEQEESRVRYANLFLLEELQLHLEENGQPALTSVGQGLSLLQAEIADWLTLH